MRLDPCPFLLLQRYLATHPSRAVVDGIAKRGKRPVSLESRTRTFRGELVQKKSTGQIQDLPRAINYNCLTSAKLLATATAARAIAAAGSASTAATISSTGTHGVTADTVTGSRNRDGLRHHVAATNLNSLLDRYRNHDRVVLH